MNPSPESLYGDHPCPCGATGLHRCPIKKCGCNGLYGHSTSCLEASLQGIYDQIKHTLHTCERHRKIALETAERRNNPDWYTDPEIFKVGPWRVIVHMNNDECQFCNISSPSSSMCGQEGRNPNNCAGVAKDNTGDGPVGSSPIELMEFGEALKHLRSGLALSRRCWHHDQYICLQKPDYESKMSLPYLYIVTPQHFHPEASRRFDGKHRMPFMLGDDDLFAYDWYIVSPK
jgi:hypothetical protein